MTTYLLTILRHTAVIVVDHKNFIMQLIAYHLISNNLIKKSFETYSIPEHLVHTNDPMVMSTYVGPLWSHSKHFLFSGMAVWNSRIETVCFSLSFWLWVLLLLLDFRLISEHNTYKISLGKKLGWTKNNMYSDKIYRHFFQTTLTDWLVCSVS